MDLPETKTPEAAPQTTAGSEAAAAPAAPPERTFLDKVFLGKRGLRSGWRLLIFFALLFAIGSGTRMLVRAFNPAPAGPRASADFIPEDFVVSEWMGFLRLLLATMIMAGIEGRKTGEYGLSRRAMFGKKFWEGAALGFGGITLVLVAMRVTGNYDFGSVGLHGMEVWRNAGIYALLFLGVGFNEEYSFRGYPLYTLADGINFWPAALVVSVAFGAVHGSNGGETPAGLVSVAVFSLTFCWVLLRTGDLWLAVGFHMTWDWGESYFYGVPDSGLQAPGHLLNPTYHGPVWLTGGTVGPEGSIYTPIALLLVALWVGWRYKGTRYKKETPDVGRQAPAKT